MYSVYGMSTVDRVMGDHSAHVVHTMQWGTRALNECQCVQGNPQNTNSAWTATPLCVV